MSSVKILLVDDEIPFVETITKRLIKRNFDVLTAFSGNEGIKQLKEHMTVEVVLLDVKMPGMNGIETLGEIKKLYPILEVIMLTGHATVESAIEGMKLGAFDYLMKPCDINQLVSKVEEAAAKKRMHEDKIIEARVKEITSKRA